jgi:hypothetical protein
LVTPIDLAWLAKLDGEHLGLAAELEFCAVLAQFSGLQIGFENPKPDNLRRTINFCHAVDLNCRQSST